MIQLTENNNDVEEIICNGKKIDFSINYIKKLNYSFQQYF